MAKVKWAGGKLLLQMEAARWRSMLTVTILTVAILLYSHRVVRQRQWCTAAHLRTTTSQSISATDLSGATTGDPPVHHARRHQP